VGLRRWLWAAVRFRLGWFGLWMAVWLGGVLVVGASHVGRDTVDKIPRDGVVSHWPQRSETVPRSHRRRG
jgi:hypothetical protein